MNYKWAGVTLRRIMHSPQPYFKMCEGTVPAEELYDERKDYRADMDPFNPPVFSSYKRTENEE